MSARPSAQRLPGRDLPLDVETVPTFLRGSLYTLLLVTGSASVFLLGRFGPLNTTVLLDAWLILFLVHSLFARKLYTVPLFFGTALYLVCARIVPAAFNSAPLEDFLQAYRWAFYILILAVAVGRRWGPVEPLTRVTLALIGMAVVKATLTLIIIGPGERPGLLLENNFELALFSGMLIVCYNRMGRFRGWSVVALGVLTVLSGSRSGAVSYLILVVFVVWQARIANLFYRYVLVLGILGVGGVAVAIFEARAAASPYRVDRLNFLEVFQNEVANWTVFEWLIGTQPLTPLSPGACDHLNSYEGLFSSVGDGSCYSVILHAFLMRVVFDAGLVGLALIFGSLLFTMRKANVTWPVTIALFGVALANSASVSGPNNPYVLLPVLLAIVSSSAAGPEEVWRTMRRPTNRRELSRLTQMGRELRVGHDRVSRNSI